MEVVVADSVPEESCAVMLRCVTACHSEAFIPCTPLLCEADQCEHLWPTLCPLTKSKMAAITGTQWRGKIRVPKVFNSSIGRQNLLRCVPFSLRLSLAL